MLPLPRVSTTQYWKTARAFNTAAEYLELSPADWNLAWRKHTADADFWEWPVPIYYWSKNVFYTGPSVEVRPTIHSFLADFLDPDENYITLVEIGGLGSGKGLSLETPLATPSGWTTMGEVKAGDELLDETGRACRVKWVSDVHNRPCYKVSFDDGTSIVCDDEHQWSTLSLVDRNYVRQRGALRTAAKAPARRGAMARAGDSAFGTVCPSCGGPKAKQAHECHPCSDRSRGFGERHMVSDWRDAWDDVETSVVADLIGEVERGTAKNHAVPCCRPLVCPEVELPIDPYVLGSWLGDGTSSVAAITNAKADSQILDEIRSAGWTCEVIQSTADKTAPAYALSGPDGDSGRVLLEIAGVFRNKHIPAVYLRASYEQRLALLQGLMDTDGGMAAAKGPAMEISQKKSELAEGLLELVRSLGWKPSMAVGRSTLRGKDCGPRHRIRFISDVCPFRLERKRAHWSRSRSREHLRASCRLITAIEETPSVPTRCLSVDSPRSLFLAGDAMVPTHNSFSGMVLILYALYLLSCLRNPQEFLRDSPGCSIGRDDPIVVLGTSAAGARQAIKVTFNLVMDKILASPYFERYFAPYAGRASELEFDHNISFSPGTSEWRSVLGWNIFAFTLDEAAFGQDTERADYVAELFKNLEYRRHSRFGPMGFGCLFTSPGSEYGYVESLARDAREWNRNILVRRTTTWEARGELVPVEGWTEMSVKERVGKGVRTFLLASGESPRVLEANLTFLEAGACMRDDGQVLIYGDAGQRLRARLAARGVDLSNISDIADVYPLQDV